MMLVPSLADTGNAGLNDILGGGLPANRVYLLHGSPGAGKTTLAIQFLMAGVKAGERVMYVTLSETKMELTATAASHGWNLDGIDIVELVASEDDLIPDNQFTMFQPAELELSTTTKEIIDQINQVKPARVVIDSLSEVKLLAQNTLRYRRQVMALKQFFIGRNCTALFLDDKTATRKEDKQLESIAHGVINLEQLTPEYGAERRRVRITKLRGQKYRGGYHDFTIAKGGLAIFPRLMASEHARSYDQRILSSGIAPLDKMMGGGIEYGTSVLLLGPAGSGKSSLALQYAHAAAQRGERAAVFTFDERIETILQRTSGIGIDLTEHMQTGFVTLQAIDPAELSPGEFVHMIRLAAEGTDGHPAAKIVVIDSLNGYLNAMPEEHYLNAQLHELLTYLGHRNVVTILVVAQNGLLGHAMRTPVDTSYLADSVILFRFFEAVGEVKQAISVLKKRSSNHERTIREFKIDSTGLRVGDVLKNFQGVMTGVPVYLGNSDELMHSR